MDLRKQKMFKKKKVKMVTVAIQALPIMPLYQYECNIGWLFLYAQEHGFVFHTREAIVLLLFVLKCHPSVASAANHDKAKMATREK